MTLRTLRRVSLELNRTKWDALCDLARRYRAEKNTHLPYYHADAQFAASASERTRRDALVNAQYASPNGLQSRMWKLAQKDAYETVEKQWAALAEDLKPLLARHEHWSEIAKHYAHWLIYTPRRLAQLVCGRAPVPTKFTPSDAEQKTVHNYLRRVIRKKRGNRPMAKAARSIAFDPNMYSLFEKDGRQYISLMSRKPKARIVVPLTGNTPIVGNLRVVLDFERRRVEVHYTADLKPVQPLTGEPCGLDAGLTEVFTDEQGHRYGEEFGPTLAAISGRVFSKGKARGKLRALAEKAEARGDTRKAARIRQFNLGRKKMRAERRRAQAEIARQVNTAINAVSDTRQPSVVVTERLDIRGKAKSKHLARRVSQWARGTLKERTEFKASAEGRLAPAGRVSLPERGFRREQANPAYSSQTCPACGFVHADNRRGDRFQCLHCGHMDHADRVAAINLKARLFDSEITLWTPKERVKEILLDRFYARLERKGERRATNVERASAPTVSGRTPGASHEARRRAKRPTQSRAARENVGAKLG